MCLVRPGTTMGMHITGSLGVWVALGKAGGLVKSWVRRRVVLKLKCRYERRLLVGKELLLTEKKTKQNSESRKQVYIYRTPPYNYPSSRWLGRM